MSKNSIISKIKCRKVFDSRETLTIEAEFTQMIIFMVGLLVLLGLQLDQMKHWKMNNDDRYNGKDIKEALYLIEEKISLC